MISLSWAIFIYIIEIPYSFDTIAKLKRAMGVESILNISMVIIKLMT